jgi:hypothetical protein
MIFPVMALTYCLIWKIYMLPIVILPLQEHHIFPLSGSIWNSFNQYFVILGTDNLHSFFFSLLLLALLNVVFILLSIFYTFLWDMVFLSNSDWPGILYPPGHSLSFLSAGIIGNVDHHAGFYFLHLLVCIIETCWEWVSLPCTWC